MSIKTFESMNIQEMKESLADLISPVSRGKQRVEVVGAAGERCVLIGKQELDGLEQAIAILSETDEFRDISNSLSRLAASTMHQPVA